VHTVVREDCEEDGVDVTPSFENSYRSDFLVRCQTAQTGAAKSFYAGSMDKGLQDLLLSGSL